MPPRSPAALSLFILFTVAAHGGEAVASAQKSTTSTPNVDLITTVIQAPTLQSARSRAEAARARTDSAARFADPTLEIMYGRVNDGMQKYPMWEATLNQPLPKAGERAADRERAAAAVKMAEADYALMAGEMAADTAMALAEAVTARERMAVLSTQITRTERVLAAIDARLSAGSGRIAERLALQSNIAAMQLMVAKDERMAEDALADARARLGLPADTPLPSLATPEPASLDENQSPARLIAAAKAAESVAMARMARASARPMTSVGLRFNREEQSMANMDTVSVAFMTELPFRSRRYARADQSAARADEAAAHAEAASAGYRLAAVINRVERADRLAATTRRLANETSRRLDAEYESFIRTAGTADGMIGESAVLMINDILERHTSTQLQVIEADGAVRIARAELWRYAPASSFPLTP